MTFAKRFNIKVFDNPESAIKYINQQQQLPQTTANEEMPKPEGESEVWVKRVLTRQNAKRFDENKITEVSVVVVDYSMPNMTGIEFCEKIETASVKRILLTGFATSTDAVKAFNNNTIHYYLQKNDDKMLQELEASIHRLQQAYFNELSSSIKAEAIDSGTPFFADPQLAAYFQSTCESLGIDEYYFLSNPSRFSLHTKQGERFVCVVCAEEDIQEHLQVLVEEQAPEALYQQLESRQFVPYFKTVDGYFEPTALNPEKQLHPATCVQGKVNYYCAIIPESAAAAPAPIKPNTAKLH